VLARILMRRESLQQNGTAPSLVTSARSTSVFSNAIEKCGVLGIASLRPDHDGLVQDVYGAAFGNFARAAGIIKESSYVELLASAVRVLKADIIEILCEDRPQGRAIDRAQLQHLRGALTGFERFVQPFHEQVARMLESEYQRKLEELHRWVIDVSAGRQLVDEIIRDTMLWLDSMTDATGSDASGT
jgi:hypothetical protein